VDDHADRLLVVEDRRRFRNELDDDRQQGLADGVVDGFGDLPEQLSAEELVEALIDILADAPEDANRADPESHRTGGHSDEPSDTEPSEVTEPQAPESSGRPNTAPPAGGARPDIFARTRLDDRIRRGGDGLVGC